MGRRWDCGRKGLIAGAALALAGLGAESARANVTYLVDQTVDVGGVTGFITTDGTLGLISAANIVAWDLQLTGNGASLELKTSNSEVYGQGSDLFATSKEITFDYDGVDGGFLVFQEPAGKGNGEFYWCNSTSAAFQNTCLTGVSVVPQYYQDGTGVFAEPSGTRIVATAPEPATWVMLVVGFGGLAFAASRGSAKPRPDSSA